MSETFETLEKMEKVGFQLLGDTFKYTLAYIQIQRKKRELTKKEKVS